jgi:hypothetical protein
MDPDDTMNDWPQGGSVGEESDQNEPTTKNQKRGGRKGGQSKKRRNRDMDEEM